MFSDMITHVKDWTGINSDAKVKAAINAVYRTIVNRFFWPQLTVRGTVTLVAGTQIYSLDSFSPTFRWVKRAWYRSGTDGSPIPLGGSKGIFQDSGSGGTVFRFRIRKRTSDFVWIIELDDIPNQAFIGQHSEIELEYYYQPPDLVADGDVIRFDAGDVQVVEYGAVVLLVGKQSDFAGFQMFQVMFKDAIGDMEEKAIDFFGRPVVGPGPEITEGASQGHQDHDYGRRVGGADHFGDHA